MKLRFYGRHKSPLTAPVLCCGEARGSVMVEALGYKPEDLGFETPDEVNDFFLFT
jgi:hypothetical protein